MLLFRKVNNMLEFTRKQSPRNVLLLEANRQETMSSACDRSKNMSRSFQHPAGKTLSVCVIITANLSRSMLDQNESH